MPNKAKRPRTKPPAERREELMKVAQKLFLAHGVAATTVEQITNGAGVAKGTFYLYFASKDDVLAALGERFARTHRARIEAALAEISPADWRAKLARWAASGVATYLDLIRLHDLLFFGPRPMTREGLVDNIVIDHLAELLRAGAAAGAWSLANPRLTAVFLFSGLHAAVDDAYSRDGKRLDRARLTRDVTRLFFRAAGFDLA